MLAAAVLGSPIEHSLSPQIHVAAYRALGLMEWDYERILCTGEDLPIIVASASPELRGFSVTMPCKEAALNFADSVSHRARAVQSANTLVRRGHSWWADCTDIDGAAAAVHCSGYREGRVVLLGAGATARPYLRVLHDEDCTAVMVVSRDASRAKATVDLAQGWGMDVSWLPLHDAGALRGASDDADLVISTLPGDAASSYVEDLGQVKRLVDVVYSPGQNTVAQQVKAHGGTVIDGRTMLLHQAITQVELFTDKTVTPDVVEAMAAVLREPEVVNLDAHSPHAPQN